jgi:hypothetical protein
VNGNTQMLNRHARWLALVATLAVAACSGNRPPATIATPPAIATAATNAAAPWPKVYLDAIDDALNPEPSEVVTNLVAIAKSNPMLTWRQFPDGERVLVASLVSNTSFYPAPGATYNTGMRDTWVTAVPEMRRTCTQPGFAGNDLAMRLRQLLGLTPTAGVTAFVEFWALPSTMFRPAPDNEITDTTAGLTMPATAEPWFRRWFNDLRSKQFFQSVDPRHDAYPWTMLGYTYDWGGPSRQGLSEFVVRQQSSLIVNAITAYGEYCAPTPR